MSYAYLSKLMIFFILVFALLSHVEVSGFQGVTHIRLLS